MTSDQAMRSLADEATQGPWDADAEFIAACREWVPDALRRLDNARVIARKLLEASGAYSTLDATPEFPEAYQLAQDLYEALDEKGTNQ